jgi:hypothetical protein
MLAFHETRSADHSGVPSHLMAGAGSSRSLKFTHFAPVVSEGGSVNYNFVSGCALSLGAASPTDDAGVCIAKSTELDAPPKGTDTRCLTLVAARSQTWCNYTC